MADIVAITVERGGGLEQPMDPRFGRAPAFLIVDAETGQVVAVEPNAAASAGHGAGIAAAAAVANTGARSVISGRFGPKAYQALAAMKVVMWTAPPGLTVAQALESYREGSLRREAIQELR